MSTGSSSGRATATTNTCTALNWTYRRRRSRCAGFSTSSGTASPTSAFAGQRATCASKLGSDLDHTPLADPDLRIDAAALRYPFNYGAEEAADLAATVRPHYPAPEIERWARRFIRVGKPTETGHLLMTLCFAIHESFAYARRSEHGTQLPAKTLQLRRGTCRDFALLMMEAVRTLGFAARFVTGYVYVPDRDGSVTRGGGSTHAWCEVYLPGAGWVEFDPTNGIVGNRDLIRVGVARDPSQAVPLSGSYDGRASDFKEMTVQVNVTTDGPDGAPPPIG